MHLVPEDAETLTALTGIPQGGYPPAILAEYELRLRFLHKVTQGPLGHLGLIDMLRFLGVAPAGSATVDRHKVDWSSINKHTPVEAERGNNWVPGTFQGLSSHGAVDVMFADGMVDEFPSFRVRLAKSAYSPDLHQETMERKPDLGPPAFAESKFASVKQGDVVMVTINGEQTTGRFQSFKNGKARLIVTGQKTVSEHEPDSVELQAAELAGA